MMTNLKKILLGSAMLASSLLPQRVVSQTTQLKGWHLAPQLIDMQGATPVLRPTAFTPYFPIAGQNSIYDSEGKLLFYIAAGGVYNKFNQSISTLSPTYLALSEICIVPHPLNSACFNKYYLIYPEYQSSKQYGNLRYDLIDMNGNSGRGQYVSGASLAINFGNITGIPLAVSKLSGGKRFVYCVGGSLNQLLMFEINSSGVSTTVNQLTPALGASLTGYELELSNAGDKIAFLSGVSSADEMTVMNLNPATGLQTGTPFTFNSKNIIYGLEFNNLGDKLYYSNGSGIWVKQLTSPFNNTLISSSPTFAKSMLEKNYNGNLILCASTSQLNWIDATTDLLGSSPISCSLAYNPSYNFVLMPDQIDGENYDATGTINVDVDIHNTNLSGTWTMASNPLDDYQQNTYLGSGFTKFRIARQINIPNAISINMNKMTFEFYTNAELNVNGGGNLTSTGTLMQGHPCGLMWRGISVNNNNVTNTSNFTMINSGLSLPIIYDAIRGVEVNGANVTTSLTNALFNKNEKSVVLNSVTPSLTNIKSSFFYATLPLKDQTKGQVLTTSGTTKYGITGIEANTSGTSINKLLLGSATAGQGNYFESGQYGIRSFRTDVSIQNNTFNNVDKTAISADANFMGTRETDVLSNTFTSNNTDVWAVFNCNLTAQKNTSTGCKQFCMRWHYNYGNKLTIGDVNNNTLGNTFTGYMWAGVAVSDCDNASTKIEIERNTFQNAPWAGGVYIGEATLTSGLRTYDYYRIRNNTFNNVQGAVNVVNVKGENGTTNNNWDGDADLSSRNYDIAYNTINFATNYNVSAVGIKVENSSKNRAFNNTVSSDNSANWQNNGITFVTCPNSLIKSNTVQAGIGINLGLDMLGSNVLCNTLKYCVKGIGPGWSWMRNTGTQHGEPGIRGRQNTFISNTFDIEMYYSYDANYQWVSPNSSNINYVPGTAPYGTNIIYSITESNPCGSGTVTTIVADDSTLTEKSLSNDETAMVPQNYNANVATAQAHSKQFVDGLSAIKINNNANPQFASTNLQSLAKAQICLENKDYSGSNNYLKNITPSTSLVENNLATVLSILTTCKEEGRYEYTKAEETALLNIAASDARIGGQGVHYARGIALVSFNRTFEDPYLSNTASSSAKRSKSVTNLPTEQKQLIGLYPNPTKTNLTVTTTNGLKTINVYNNMGLKVYSHNTDGSLMIDVSSWNSGVYLLEMYDANTNKKEIKTFIKE